MTTKNTFTNRLLSILLCIAMLVAYLPANTLQASAAAAPTQAADPSTMDSWKEYFLPSDGSLSTENAGGVWTDKSVFTNANAFTGTGITRDGDNSFLVALSAIATNKTVTGMSSVPTDTMLVLDVSGSMGSDNNNVAQQLVLAANQTIRSLLEMNENNRVGVVLYSGNLQNSQPTPSDTAVVLLPLGRYTTNSTQNIREWNDESNSYVSTTIYQYLSYSSQGGEYVGVNSTVKDETTGVAPTAVSKQVVGGTYIQRGIMLAKDQFMSADTTAQDPIQGTVNRMPILVLMSDGAPTIGNSNFVDPTDVITEQESTAYPDDSFIGNGYDMGTGSSTTAGIGFVTQLSAAYAKQQIETKYGEKCLFYTLGLGSVNDDATGRSVLDPSNSSNALSTFWTDYTAQTLPVGGQLIVHAAVTQWVNGNRGQPGYEKTVEPARTVTKIEGLSQNYVTEYFPVTGSGSSLASGLTSAFKEIVAQISMQSKYFPTLVSTNEDVSGYVSFVDRVGQYMKVTDVKGILIHNTLFSGADLASNFVSGGGSLGTMDNPTSLGDEMVWAVMARLGLSNADQARTLINLAYQYGQLSYTSATEFSNYIGWYANAAGEFLGFWHEGITTMPDPSDPTLTDATRPAYIMKSYGYLGEVNETQGTAKSDMMYAVVQLRESIATGEQTVIFGVPAALVPVLTYNVSLDSNKAITGLTATGASSPIRLVYEVALDPAINAYTVHELVSEDYLAKNTDANGAVSFYTNQYEVDNTTGFGKVNTYSYFNPSRQNDRYYYLDDTLIYSDTNGTLYAGTAKPTGTMYRQHIIYEKNGNSYSIKIGYHQLTSDILGTAQNVSGTQNWCIPKGSVRMDFERYSAYKGGLDTYNASQNLTGTLPYANQPYVDTTNHSLNDTGYNYVIGATLGNNGKLSLVPSAGIKLTKTLAAGATATTEKFTFELVNTTNASDNSTYPAYLVASDGTTSNTSVKFTAGKASVQLAAGETLYIGDMTAGQVIRITEQETVSYIVSSVNGSSQTQAEVTIPANDVVDVAFVNTDRGTGNLTVAKVVEHDFGTEYQIPADKVFTITVTLTGVGTANATFQAKQTGSTITSITTDANGSFTVQLKHNEQLEVFGLPAGTVATVVESDPGTGFAAQYWNNGVLGTAGQVTVEQDRTVSVIVVNDYTPNKVYPVNITVSGTKTLTGREWLDTDVFTFRLEKLTGVDTWQTLGTVEVKGSDTNKSFNFADAFANEEYTAAGSYYYRVVEVVPETPLGGVTYDRTVHAFVVVVADADMDGQLEIAEVRAERPASTAVTQPDADSWNVQVNFTNSYSTSGSATVTIDLNKLVTNPSESSHALPSGFQFGLYEEGKTEPTFTSEKTTERGFARLVLTYTTPGTYVYTLKEIVPDPVPAGWVYSVEEVKVTVVVTDDKDGTISAVIYKGTEEAGAGISISASFTNEYKLTEAQLPIDFVSKQLTGRAMIAGEFTFAVQDLDGNVLLTGTNDANGKVTFNDTLKFTKVGIYFYNVVETTVDGNGITVDKNTYRVTVTVIDDGNGALSASYVLVNAEGDQIVFQNTYTTQSVTNTLGGIKFLEGRNMLNDEFTFRLTEALDASGNTAADAAYVEATNTEGGHFTFPAQTYTAAGTYYYLVTEATGTEEAFGVTYDKTAFVVTVKVVDNGLGQLVIDSVTYAIKGGTDVAGIVFVNKYVADSTVAQILGDKALVGKVLGQGQFSFELYESDAQWNQGTKLETVTNHADGTFSFAPFTIHSAGSYYYLVKEVNGGQTIDGVTYDATVYRIRVDATDDLRGQLHAQIYVFDQNNVPQGSVSFVNVYKIIGSDKVTITGEKTLEGRDLADGEFTFELYEADSSFAIRGAAIKKAVNSGNAFALELTYTSDHVGNTYYYVLKEANAGQTINGVTYSSEMYYITVVVADNGVGGITTTTSISNGQAPVASISFTNTYTAEETKVSFAGIKELENKDLAAGDFHFDLFAADSNFVPHNVALQSVVNGADGKFSFTDVSLTEAKTYYFLIKENSQTPAGGISYDHAEYHITVVVKDDGNGKLYIDSQTMVRVEEGNSTTATEIRFVNTYDAKNVSIVLGGNKVLTGRDLLAGEFTFHLYQTDATFTPIGARVAMVAVNSADGSFLFDALTFHDAGTYYYIITEDASEKLERVTYDETVYQITLQVTDNGQGQLVIGEPIITKKGSEATAESVVFNNVYTPKPQDISVTLNVDKTVVNKGSEHITPEGFQFVLENTATGETLTVKSDSHGDAAFKLNFTEDDKGKTYTYKLYEVDNHRANVTYSTKVYDVSISISLNANNVLVAELKLDNAAVTQIDVAFVNEYNYTPADVSVYVAVDKTVTNKGTSKITPEGFEFVLENTVTGEKKVLKTNSEGVALFDLVFGVADAGKTFTYTLSETNDARDHVTYDTTVYNISVKVTLNAQGLLETEVTVDNVAVSLVDAKFVNVYDYTPSDLAVELEINKTVVNKGTEKIGPENFKFQLENLATGEKLTVKSDKNGKAIFELRFTAQDVGKTFTYHVTEIDDGRNYITYSQKAYTITVAVSETADQRLVAEVTVDGKATADAVLAFENVFDYTSDPDPDPDPDPKPDPDPGKNPDTGDRNHLGLWMALLFVSGGCILATTATAKKKEQN